MSFQFSPELDRNKVFLVKSSLLEERLDAEYYQPYHYRDLQHLERSPYSLKKLIHVSSRVVDGPFGSAIKASDYVNDGVPFIRVADVTRGEGTIKTDDLIFISNEAHQKISRSKVSPNDVVIAKTGATMGAASVIPQEISDANIRGDLGALTLIAELCFPQYLMTYINTPIGQRLFWRLDSGGTRGRVVIGNLKKYPVLVPPKEIQGKIVAKMDAAYAAKKQKEAEAQRLLDSIDNYLLDKLGIELPEQEENTIQSRMFTRRLREISGGRFDPKLYDNKTKTMKEAILNTSYPTKKLKNLLVQSIAGDWGKDITDELGLDYQKCLVIRATEFDNFYNLKLYNSRVKFRLIQKNKLRTIDIQANDLLIEKSGGSPDQPVGRIAIISKEILEDNNLCYSNFIHKIRVSSQLNPEYLFCFLKTIHSIKLTDAMQSQTNGIRNLIMKDYLNQRIPLPPIEKQTEIADHITTIRHQAKTLQQQAKTDLEQAKKEVEAMILGDNKNGVTKNI